MWAGKGLLRVVAASGGLALGIASAPAPAVAQAPAGFADPVVVTGRDTGEPGIDVASDGTLYVNAPGRLLSRLPTSPSYLFRSDDGGATWTETPFGLRQLFPGGGDSDVSLDQSNGTVYFTDLWVGDSTVSSSRDKGQTWVAQPIGGVPIQDRQWIATTGGGVVYHAYNQLPLGLLVSKSLDRGVTFPLHAVAANRVDTTGCICPPGLLIAEGGSGGGPLHLTDRVGLIYPTSLGGVKFARSSNGGLGFRSVEIAPADSGAPPEVFPVVANAGGDHLVATFLSVTNERTRVMFSDSHDWGATWSEPRAIVSDGTSAYPWVDAHGSKVAVSLYHNGAGATPDSTPADVPWFESYLESADGGASFSPLATVDPTSVKTGPICTEGTACGMNRELLDFQSVAIDTADRANVTWTRSIDNVADTEIRFAHQP